MKVTATHRVAITARYVGPTNHQGPRILVSTEGRRTTRAWDYDLNPTENACAAIAAHVEKMGWGGSWVVGSLPDGRWVAVPGVPERCAKAGA